ncbi:MAG: hypothetical protein E5V74_00200 [Mesorhizobium sp.]|nr:MAG: hypothetical protein E5W03_00070 [Mesorhizobium sp.]TIV25236.1 MAG: hypothetical protein E5W02_00115 [Mesorhizobium sp.]TIV68122.1 MAG: hypothetical protein E5V86_02155 [Mesorhizobium sp.]TIW06074.1 MAG: hypothetical protein E5V74_00200 [Mesorhizobium sp.]
MQVQSGYWWARIFSDSAEPEIIYIGNFEGEQIATRMGDDWPYNLIECDLLMPIDTSIWPQKGKLIEDELLDEHYTVDPTTIADGYWWAIIAEDFQPLIVRVERGAVYRLDCEDSFDNFEFMMPIDTTAWPRE